MKKHLSILTVLVLCVMLITSIPVSAVSKPAKPKKFKITDYNPVYNTVTVSLKEKKNLNYELKVFNSKGKLQQKIKADKYNQLPFSKYFPHTIKNITSNQFYKIVARAYKTKNGKKIYSKKSKPVYACQKVDCNLDWGTHALKWDKVKGATRYVVSVSKSNEAKSFTKLATTKDTKFILNDSIYNELGKSFYAQIIAQKKVKNKYYSSSWTASYEWHM